VRRAGEPGQGRGYAGDAGGGSKAALRDRGENVPCLVTSHSRELAAVGRSGVRPRPRRGPQTPSGTPLGTPPRPGPGERDDAAALRHAVLVLSGEESQAGSCRMRGGFLRCPGSLYTPPRRRGPRGCWPRRRSSTRGGALRGEGTPDGRQGLVVPGRPVGSYSTEAVVGH